MILSCGIVITMCCHCLVILDTLRLVLKYSLYFLSILYIKKHSFGRCSVDQFSTKISPQSDTPTLVKVMRTIYSLDLILISSPNVEITINVPEAKEVAFTLITNKKHKRKNKFFMSSSDYRSKILFIS